jgi:hypothetical protein
MRRNDDVTAVIIFEAVACIILGSALLIGLIKWLG